MPKTGLKLQRGDKINIPVWSVHHDWKYYPNPELFDPDRFTPEKKESRPAGTFLSFGEGPRFCMGKWNGIIKGQLELSAVKLKLTAVALRASITNIGYHNLTEPYVIANY